MENFIAKKGTRVLAAHRRTPVRREDACSLFRNEVLHRHAKLQLRALLKEGARERARAG